MLSHIRFFLKEITIGLLSFILIGAITWGAFSYYTHTTQKDIPLEDIDSVVLWGVTNNGQQTRTATHAETEAITNWFNTSSSKSNNQEFVSSMPDSGITIKLKSSKEIQLFPLDNSYEIQRTDTNKRYFAKEANLEQLLQKLQTQEYWNK